jgi:undecaprenyl-diphosphatase
MKENPIKEYQKLLMLIIIGTVQAAIIAFILKSLFEYSFCYLLLLAVGFFLQLGLRYSYGFPVFKTVNKEIGIVDSAIIETAQGFSVLSSITRSSVTISIGMIRKVDHHKSIRHYFLLSIPAHWGASIRDFLLMDEKHFQK